MYMLYGYRKFIITVLGMGVATTLLLTGHLDSETFKWMMNVTMVAYLVSNAVKGIASAIEK